MKRIISLVIFIVIGIIALLSTKKYFGDDDQQLAQSKRYVELFMNEFEMTVMNDSGIPAYTLTGKHLERYNDSKDTKVDSPVIHLLESGKQWLINAEIALLNDEKNTIQLKNNVVMQQQNAEPAITLRTQSITFHTRTQIAQTQAKVDFIQGKSQLKSTGMIYNNRTSKLELTSSVSGFYLPYD